MNTNYLKYPFYLFMAILIAKFGYILVESFYNYHVLVTTTSAELSQEAIEALNKNGHRISSVGITLLLVPFFYLLVKKRAEKTIYIFLTVVSIITYLLTYNMLNKAVDYIVESHKEKRHDAYYVNIFKYGILNNIFAYDSFIDSKKVENKTIDVNDRILLTNSFLLLHADEKLIDKLKERGKEAVADIYISRHKKEDYQKNFKAFEDATKQINTLWIEFNNSRNKLYSELKKYEDEKIIKKAHNDLVSSVKTKYYDYVKLWKDVDKKIEKETTQARLESIGKDLSKYFRYQKYNSAQKQYKEKMNKEFGHYIEPNRWKNSNNDLTYESIKKVITEEILSKAKQQSPNIPKGLNAKQFFNNLEVKIQVSKKLKKEGIKIPVEFDYSYSQFKKYFIIAMTHESNKAPKVFYKKLADKIGKNDLKLDMDEKDFLNSNYIKEQVKQKLNTNNKKDIENIIKAIQSKDLGNFKRFVYLPRVIDEINEMMYKPKDFLDGGKAAQFGDDAIKLLYIPPFALAVSMIALLLNFVTVVGMGLQYIKTPNVAVNLIKVLLFLVIVFTPVVSKFNGLENDLIGEVSTPEIQTYLNFLNWVSYYESMNSKWH